jgi:hypothetical protein
VRNFRTSALFPGSETSAARRSLRLPFLAALLHLAEYAAVFSAHDSVGFRQVPPPDCGVAGGNKPN